MREVVHSFLNYGTAHSRTVGEMLVYEQIAQSVEGHEAQFYMALKTLFERRQTITLGELRMAAGLSPVIAFTSPRLPRTYASPTEIGSAASRSSITPRGNTLNDLQTALMATRSGPNPSTSRYDEHRSSARTGMPLTSVEGGYVGDKGQFYVPGGSDGAINAKTGQFEPFEYTGR